MMKAGPYTDDMAEISGLGDGHDAPPQYAGWDEASCRALVLAGCRWFEGRKDAGESADPHFVEDGAIRGLIGAFNEDAQSLTAAMLDAAGGVKVPTSIFYDCLMHVLVIQQQGWEEYAKQMRQAKLDRGKLHETKP